jgi:hypothetical protein
MRLAGLDITDDALLDLVVRLRRAGNDHLADTIVGALMTQQSEVALIPPDRVAILKVLDDPPEVLVELRGVLLSQHEWLRDEGLA